MSTKVLFTFEAEDLGVAKKQDEIADRMKAIRKEIAAAKQQGSPYTDLLKESQTLKREQDELRKKQRELNKEFAATKVPKDSLAGLRLEYSKLVTEINNLSAAQRKSDFGRNLIAQAALAKTQINALEAEVGRFTGNVGNYQKGLLKIGDAITGGLITGGVFALTAAFAALGAKVVSTNSQVSDSIADVAKTTGATIETINQLSDSLEKRDTRTSLVDQLGIAKIGGQLGVVTEDLYGFVEAVDVVNIALGDQFGGSVEETTDVIGKLRNVLTDIKSDNIGEDILNIGNALNYLEAQGVASAGSIADFSGRIGGVGQAFNISSGKILGVSTTLSELSVNAERGSTAFISLVQRVGRSPEAFAKAIDVPAKEFKKLVNDDIFGAVEQFVSKLNDKNLSNTELASVLKSLKLTGAGVSEVVAKLGGNVGILDQRVAQATKALGESSSVTQEYEKKNATLGASLDDLSNAFSNLLTSGTVGGGLANFINGVADAIDGLANATDKLFDYSAASSGAATANAILADSFSEAVEQIENESVATERNFNILRDGRATQQQRQEAISDLVKLYPSLLTQQQLESANINQLNGLQLLSTNVLRAQITERIKLRAKEQIETEIIQKKLRQVELDATPDRALLGELTAGETVRNFGVLDPAKLRSNIKGQFASDIAQLESGLKRIDQNFASLQRSAEDTLSASEQDALDKFRQFNEGGKSVLKTVGDVTISSETLGKSIDGVADKTDKAAKGSIQFFADEVKRLQEQLEKTPVKSPTIDQLVKDLKAAEIQLRVVEQQLKDIKNPPAAAQSEFDQANAGLAELGVSVSDGGDAKQQLIALAKSLAESVGVVIPVDIEGDKALNDLDALQLKIDKKETDQAEKDKENRIKVEEAITDAAIQSAQTVADSVFQIKENELERYQSSQLEKLNEQEEKAIQAANGNAAKEKQIRADFEKKRAALEKEGAEKRKELAKKEALINIALSITKALTGAPPPFNFILAGVAAIAGAAQLAVIDSQEFYAGGMVKPKRLGSGTVRERQNAPRTAHGDTVLAYVKPGEMLLTEGQQSSIRSMAGHNVFARAGVPGSSSATPVPHFASGGLVGDIVPQTTAYSYAGAGAQPVNAEFTDAQIVRFGQIIAGQLSASVGAEVRTGIGVGLGDANRRLEREEALQTNRQG